MSGLRDADAFRAKSIEVQESILRALDSGIQVREAYSKPLDAVRALGYEPIGVSPNRYRAAAKTPQRRPPAPLRSPHSPAILPIRVPWRGALRL